MSVLTFYWLRHAPPINPDKICYGEDMAVDLSSRIRTAIRRQAKNLPCNADWIASPILRTMQTAKVFSEIKNHQIGQFLPIKIDTNGKLKEQSFGEWTGRRHKDLFNDAAFQNYMDDVANIDPPRGESLNRFSARVHQGIDEIINANPDGGNKIIVAHAGTIRAALSRATGMKIEDTLLFSIDPLSLTVIAYDPVKTRNSKCWWRVEHLNIRA